MPDPTMHSAPGEERIARTIDEWYSAAWRRGIRLDAGERNRLARFIAQREEAHRVIDNL